MDEAEEAFVDAAEERHLEAQALEAEPRYAASAAPIAEAYAKAHVLSLHLAAKIEADVDAAMEARRKALLDVTEEHRTALRGCHALLDSWAGAQQDEADAREALVAIWPILVERDRQPRIVKVPGGEVRLVHDAPSKQWGVRYVPGENRRGRRFCLVCDRWASEGCAPSSGDGDGEGSAGHDTVLATCCTACEDTGRACDACREAQG